MGRKKKLHPVIKESGSAAIELLAAVRIDDMTMLTQCWKSLEAEEQRLSMCVLAQMVNIMAERLEMTPEILNASLRKGFQLPE